MEGRQEKTNGRTGGKNSAHRSSADRFIPKKLNDEIETYLSENKDKAATKEKKVGQITQDRRRTNIKGFFGELYRLGYKIESVHNLREKHLKAVFMELEAQGQSSSTIQNKISVMRIFCEWIGKAGMVKESTNYVKDKTSVRRSMVVKEDKSWESKGIDIVSKLPEIEEYDKRIGVVLELCWAFGLRAREALMFRANVAHEGNYVWIREGTKGDRPRVIPIENEVQIKVLEKAKILSDQKTGFLGKRGNSFEQNKNRFYYVLSRCGITLKDDQISAHGLRHQYMQNSFKKLFGVDAPIKGGDISAIEKEELHIGSQKLMERAGHTRVSIGSSYYGSRRIPKKEKKEEKVMNKNCG